MMCLLEASKIDDALALVTDLSDKLEDRTLEVRLHEGCAVQRFGRFAHRFQQRALSLIHESSIFSNRSKAGFDGILESCKVPLAFSRTGRPENVSDRDAGHADDTSFHICQRTSRLNGPC